MFISYSWDSTAHKRRVLDLSDRLRMDGVDCLVDQYLHGGPPEGWPNWMARSIEAADFVLVVCTHEYAKRVSGSAQRGSGQGVKFESLLTYQDLVDADSENSRFIPVLFSPADVGYVPRPLRSFDRYFVDSEDGYEQLYRRLTNRPRVVAPPLGALRAMPVGENLQPRNSNSGGAPPSISGPAVAGPVATDAESGTRWVELRIPEKHFDQYLPEKLLAVVRAALDLGDEVRIVKMRRGSVIITLSVPASAAERLVILARSGRLRDHGVTEATILDREAAPVGQNAGPPDDDAPVGAPAPESARRRIALPPSSQPVGTDAARHGGDWSSLPPRASLAYLTPEFAARTEELLAACRARGVEMRVNETVRDPFRQARLWRQSRTIESIRARIRALRDSGAAFLADCLESVGPQHGDPVTNALPGLSWHQWGEALDCFWVVDEEAEWSTTRKVGGVNGFRVYAEEARALGLTAGAFFTSIKDFPHVQLRPAASPASLFTLPEIDRTMRERFGDGAGHLSVELSAADTRLLPAVR